MERKEARRQIVNTAANSLLIDTMLSVTTDFALPSVKVSIPVQWIPSVVQVNRYLKL